MPNSLQLDNILNGLNKSQREAVMAERTQPLQIIAGPGTGKTKVLVSRVAYLIQKEQLRPEQIIVTTFTKKAAAEMSCRLEGLLAGSDINLSRLLIGTFHSICFKLLMAYGKLIGIDGFKIANESDSNYLLNEALNEIAVADYLPESNAFLKSDSLDVKLVKKEISKLKSKAISVHKYSSTKKNNKFILQAYLLYQEKLNKEKMLDFDDCLLKCFELIEKHNVLRFVKHVLVDEFQDTNEVQLQLMYQLCRHTENGNGVTVVGDPDQSIYGFRNAQVTNFQNMKDYYSNLQIINLNENYRSTHDILNFSESLMRQQKDGRISKQLKSQLETTFPPVYNKTFTSQTEEATWISQQIKHILKLPGNPLLASDIAILLRFGSQSRSIETELMAAKIPYLVLRGKAFWERKEVVMILNYLRVIADPNDRIAYLKTLNFPKRGLGPKSISEIENVINQKIFEGSVHDSLRKICNQSVFTKLTEKNRIAIKGYLSIIDELRSKISNIDISLTRSEFFNSVYESSGLKGEYSSIEEIESNIREIESVFSQFEPSQELLPQQLSTDSRNIIGKFVDSVVLYDTEDETNQDTKKNQPKVTISTIHGSKGLEWPVVFVPGLSDGIIPSRMAIAEGGETSVKEERRILYVATTRCKQLLYLSSFIESNSRWGGPPIDEISRFIQDSSSKLPHLQAAFANEKTLMSLYKLLLVEPPIETELQNFLDTFKNEFQQELKLDFSRATDSFNLDKFKWKQNREKFPGLSHATNSKKRKLESSNQMVLNKPVQKAPQKAPTYIPVRKVPSSLLKIKKLHSMKR